MMASSEISSPNSEPSAAPSRRTSTVSEPSTTSSSSEEMSTTPSPFSASSAIRAWTSALAPTSMPRVGSSSSSTLGLRQSSRASSTFCWLPPESSRTFWSGPEALMRSRFMKTSTISRLLLAGHEADPGQLVERREADVVLDRHAGDDALGLAVLGQHRDAGADAGGRRVAGVGLALERDRARVERHRAEDGLGRLAAA